MKARGLIPFSMDESRWQGVKQVPLMDSSGREIGIAKMTDEYDIDQNSHEVFRSIEITIDDPDYAAMITTNQIGGLSVYPYGSPDDVKAVVVEPMLEAKEKEA